MTLEVELVGSDISITLAPDTDVEMATFGGIFRRPRSRQAVAARR